MVRWAVKAGPGGGGCQRNGTRPDRASGLPVVGRRLVEAVLRDGLGIREIEGRRLIELEFDLRRAPSGGHPGALMRQVEMAEDALSLPRLLPRYSRGVQGLHARGGLHGSDLEILFGGLPVGPPRHHGQDHPGTEAGVHPLPRPAGRCPLPQSPTPPPK
jgi:hypothetical protein